MFILLFRHIFSLFLKEVNVPTVENKDWDIIERFKSGDNSAFEELMNCYEGKIYSFLIRMCGCPDGAKDALQDTFLNAYRYLDGFRGESSFKTWLYRIASTSCLKIKRKRVNEPDFHISMEEFLPKEKETPEDKKPSWHTTPVEELLNQELNTFIQKSLLSIPRKYRMVLGLRDLEGFTAEETAETLKISVSAVKSRLHRARLFMRKNLEEYYKERKN